MIHEESQNLKSENEPPLGLRKVQSNELTPWPKGLPIQFPTCKGEEEDHLNIHIHVYRYICFFLIRNDRGEEEDHLNTHTHTPHTHVFFLIRNISHVNDRTLDSKRKYKTYFSSMFGMLIEMLWKDTCFDAAPLPATCPFLPLNVEVAVPEKFSLSTLHKGCLGSSSA